MSPSDLLELAKVARKTKIFIGEFANNNIPPEMRVIHRGLSVFAGAMEIAFEERAKELTKEILDA